MDLKFFYVRHICSLCGKKIGLFLHSNGASLTLVGLDGKPTTSSIGSSGAWEPEIFEDVKIFCARCAKGEVEQTKTGCVSCGNEIELNFSPSIVTVANYFQSAGQRVVARNFVPAHKHAFCSVECLREKAPGQKVENWKYLKRPRPQAHWLHITDALPDRVNGQKITVCSRCHFPFNGGMFTQVPHRYEVRDPGYFSTLRKSTVCLGCGAEMENKEEPESNHILGSAHAYEFFERCMYFDDF